MSYVCVRTTRIFLNRWDPIVYVDPASRKIALSGHKCWPVHQPAAPGEQGGVPSFPDAVTCGRRLSRPSARHSAPALKLRLKVMRHCSAPARSLCGGLWILLGESSRQPGVTQTPNPARQRASPWGAARRRRPPWTY
eukprot:5902866-Prymnesium_polylepis.1